MPAKLTSLHRHLVILALCAVGALIAYYQLRTFDAALLKFGYLLSWGGAIFRALCGGAIGFCVSRFGLRLDLSTIPADQRALAAVSQAILIAAFANAVALGT